MADYGLRPVDTVLAEDCVTVQFLTPYAPGTKPTARTYRYYCPGARIGDVITSNGKNRAKVVGLSPDITNLPQIKCVVRVVERADYNTTMDSHAAHLAARSKYDAARRTLDGVAIETIYYAETENAMHPDAPKTAVRLQDEIHTLKKAAKRAKKNEARKKAETAQRVADHRVGIDALRRLSELDNETGLAAARELLDRI